jgi:hypothetical protein
MKIFVKELKPGHHTEDLITLDSEYVPHVGDYVQFDIDHKIRTYQVCSVHRFYLDAMPEMLNSVVIKVKLA